MNSTATLYKMHTVRTYEALPEGGTWYWSTVNDERNDEYYQVDLMETREVVLPDGYFVGKNMDDEFCIFGPDRRAVPLAGRSRPMLQTLPGVYVSLKSAIPA